MNCERAVVLETKEREKINGEYNCEHTLSLFYFVNMLNGKGFIVIKKDFPKDVVKIKCSEKVKCSRGEVKCNKKRYNFGVIYNVAHDGFLMKAFAHRYQNHPNERAVFLINKTFEGVADTKAFDKTRFVLMDMHAFSNDEEGFLETRIVRRMESFFKINQVSIAKYKEVYSFVDEVDLVGIFCENNGIKYQSIEAVTNLFHRHSKFRSFDLGTVNTNNAITRSSGYDYIIIKHGLRHGGGKMCKRQVFLLNTNKFPNYVTDLEAIFNWDYKGILSSLSQNYMRQVMEFYKLPKDSLNNKNDVSLVVLSSKNMFSYHKKTVVFSDKNNLDKEFTLAYQLLADFFSLQQNSVYFKPHPRESTFNFSPFINKEILLPALFPTEIIQYIEDFNVKELISTTSSASDYFTGKNRPNSVTLGSAYYDVYPAFVKLFAIMELCRYCSIDIQNMYVSDLPQNMVDAFLRKNIDSTKINLLRLFKDVEANDNVFIIVNVMDDRDKNKLKKMIRETNKRLTMFFFKPEELSDMLQDAVFLKKVKEIVIKKTPLDDYALMGLEDELIYVFEINTNNFENIEVYSFNKELMYSRIALHASCLEKVNAEDIQLRTQAELIASAERQNKNGTEVAEFKNSKYREIGNLLKKPVNYVIKIENGVLHIELSSLPENICVGYELLFNMSSVDTLSPSYVANASFELRNFGSYSVRARFYQSDNLSRIVYRYDTEHFDYVLFSAVRSINLEKHNCKKTLDRFERLLFDENKRQEQMIKHLSELAHQMSLGYSFIDYLLTKNITSLYFYCERRDWELGRGLFSLLYNDERIKIKNCISDRPFTGEGIGDLYRKVKFISIDSCYYEKEENVFAAFVHTRSDLDNKFRRLGLNVYSMNDLDIVLQRGLFVKPYTELKQRNLNIDIVIVKRPLHLSKSDFASRSENENEIVTAKLTMQELQNQLRQYPPIIPLALEERHVTLDGMIEFSAYSQEMTCNFNSRGRPIDRRGELVNVVDGYRVTTDQPAQFDNTIYFFGSSMIYSPFTSDNTTSSSFLQRLVNSNCDKRYRVVNCGGWTSMTQSNMIKNMMTCHEYKDGDKIVVMPEGNLPKKKELDFTLIDLENIYMRPHEYGELWIGIQSNVNDTGQRLIAEGIFNGMKENGLITISEEKVRSGELN